LTGLPNEINSSVGLVLVVGMHSVRRLIAFVPRAVIVPGGRVAAAPSDCDRPAVTQQRWMSSSSSDVEDKTEEEKEALKALREERK
jgi:hypothetical protein